MFSKMVSISSSWWWKVIVTGISLSVLFYIYTVISFTSGSGDSNDFNPSSERHCVWKDTDPVIYNLKTKMGVNYDAGHWFHMSENFMTQHSILRSSGHLTNSSNVFYNFDTAGFIDNLNGITRLMVYLGTKKPNSKTEKLNFIYMKNAKKILPSVFGQTVLLEDSYITNKQVVDMSSSLTPEKRFNNHNTQLSTTSSGNSGSSVGSGSSSNNAPSSRVCAKFMGSIGGLWPTPQRGHWFPNAGDTDSFRQKMRDACPPDAAMLAANAKKKKYKMVIYQRDISRKIGNEKEAIGNLQSKLNMNEWTIEVLMHSNKRTPCELAHILHNTDMLITPHGFQSMLLMFLPRPAVVFEVFPYRYFKRGYGPFSGEYGVMHSGVMSPGTLWHTKFLLSFVTTEWCMLNKQCRGYARNQDVLLTMNGVNKVVETIEKNIHLFSPDALQIGTKLKRDFLY